MKKLAYFYCLLFIFSLCSDPIMAQTFKSAGEYMSYIGNQNQEIIKDYLSYTSAVAHSKNARKIENRRKALLLSVKDGSRKIAAMPSYKGDKSYKDSTVAFLRLTYHILNDDYGKIINLEEVAEQSYDAMEAYFLAQDLATEKSNQSFEVLRLVRTNFAYTHGVILTESNNDVLQKKMELNSKISAYHRTLYLLYFKSYKQESYLLDTLKKKDIHAIEQNNNTLIKYSDEALLKLDTMKAFRNDRSLVAACKQAQEFYRRECKDTEAIVDFFIKEENFNKIKSSMDAKKASEKSKTDIDQYNLAVADLNKAVENFNKLNNRLYNERSKSINIWNKVSQAFLDKHTPHHK